MFKNVLKKQKFKLFLNFSNCKKFILALIPSLKDRSHLSTMFNFNRTLFLPYYIERCKHFAYLISIAGNLMLQYGAATQYLHNFRIFAALLLHLSLLLLLLLPDSLYGP